MRVLLVIMSILYSIAERCWCCDDELREMRSQLELAA